MLRELSISNFAIISELRLEFEPGLNAITGETGAGKSILIDALGAVLGDRVGSDVVRTGCRTARVEATFDVEAMNPRPDRDLLLTELGVEPEDGALILSREVSATGRSAARINGRAATATALGRIGSMLVDVHGQSDHLSLLRPGEHLDILDRYAGLQVDRVAIAELVIELRTVRAGIANIVAHERERAQRIDLLQFQTNDIQAAGLRSGEDAELQAERVVLANADRLVQGAAAAHRSLGGGDDPFEDTGPRSALSALREATVSLADLEAMDPRVSALSNRLAETLYAIEEIANDLRDYRDGIEADPARLADVEDRLDSIRLLTRKYGNTIEEVIAFGESAERELASLFRGDVDVKELREQESSLIAAISSTATRLSTARVAAGKELARSVEAVIAELNMGRAEFAVSVTQRDEPNGISLQHTAAPRIVHVDETGVDRVEFLIAANAGEALKPLGRAASGGETARLMLALKSILAGSDATPTLVFDEVDVGVGGRSGQVVGEKLWRLTEGHQVLVVSHLPQIAAFADVHFRITKSDIDGRTVSNVDTVTGSERIDELAAMLDGLPVTAASRGNAEHMLSRVDTWKAGATS